MLKKVFTLIRIDVAAVNFFCCCKYTFLTTVNRSSKRNGHGFDVSLPLDLKTRVRNGKKCMPQEKKCERL